MTLNSWANSGHVGANWPAFQAAMLADEQRFSALPKSTGGKTNLTAQFPVQPQQFSSAITLPENRHYLGAHTTPSGYNRIADIKTLQNAAQEPSIGSGAALSNGMVLFPDGEILMVPNSSTRYRIMQPATETGYALSTPAPGNHAYLGGALWVDGVSALLAPHNERYAALVNKSTGLVTHLTGYDFGGNYACAGVRRVCTGEYAFIPHNHNKYVFLDPVAMTFRVLATNAPGGEAFVGSTTLSTGEIYMADHKAGASVVVDPVSGSVLVTLPPVGAGVIPITPGISNFRTCLRIPDGRVALCPYSHTRAWIYDRTTNRHIQPPGTYPFASVACMSLTSEGDVMLWPWDQNTAYRMSTGYGVLIDPQMVTSPLFNGL